jgi:hypothetical protein
VHVGHLCEVGVVKVEPLGRPAAPAWGAGPILRVLGFLQGGSSFRPWQHLHRARSRAAPAGTSSSNQARPARVDRQAQCSAAAAAAGCHADGGRTSLPKPERLGFARPSVCAPDSATMSLSCSRAAAPLRQTAHAAPWCGLMHARGCMEQTSRLQPGANGCTRSWPLTSRPIRWKTWRR